MIVHSIIIGPVPNRRFIDHERIRLCGLRFTGRREEKFFFKLFLVPAFIDGVLLVLDYVAFPGMVGWALSGKSLCKKMA